jgi:hypothetical protein
MPGYWWECEENCGYTSDFNTVAGCGIVAFFWDILSVTWDENLLAKVCGKCGKKSLRITYEFPRKEKEVIRVHRVVGLRVDDDYLPMMWEGVPKSSPGQTWFDFNYLRGKHTRGANRGLNRPAVFGAKELSELFTLYREKTGQQSFPL